MSATAKTPKNVIDDRRNQYRFHAAPSVEFCKFQNTDDSIAYEQYALEHNRSEGFDIEHFVSGPVEGTVTLKPVPKSDRSLFVLCNKAVRDVLEYLHTKDEKTLELVGVIKANYRSSHLFFITFEAKSKDLNKSKKKINKKEDYVDYQSVIYVNSKDGRTSLYLFRERTGEKLASGERVVDDQREHYKFFAVPKKCKFTGNDEFVAAYKKYAKEHNESEGFDIEHFLNEPVDGIPVLKPVPESNSSLNQLCNEAVQNVLEYLDATYEQNLELVRVIKANYRASYLFFVTFEAKSKAPVRIEQYQSVIYSSKDGETTLFLFRKRIEEVEPAVLDKRHCYIFFIAPEYPRSAFRCKKDYIAYRKYAKQHNDSEGFEIEDFVSQDIGGWNVLRPVLKSDKFCYEHCKKAVLNVLEFLDEKDEQHLELVKIISANYTPLNVYFVTFEAKSKEGKIEVYQSVIYCGYFDGLCWLFKFRKRGEVEPEVPEPPEPPVDDQRHDYVFYKVSETLVRFGGSLSVDDKMAYKRFAEEYNKSEGFEIKNFVSFEVGGGAALFPVEKSNPIFEDCEDGIEIVLKYINEEEKKNLELVKVIQANYRYNLKYFITFEAIDRDSGEIEVYQSVIKRDKYEDTVVLILFRKKESAAAVDNGADES